MVAGINCTPGPAAEPVKVSELEGPAEGGGFVTVRFTEPTGELICADRLVELLYVVRMTWFPSCTVAPEMNPVPEIVTETGGPATALLGEMDVICGAGFSKVKDAAVETPAEGGGFWTVTEAVLGEGGAMSDASIDAVNCVVLTNCVTRLMLFQ